MKGRTFFKSTRFLGLIIGLLIVLTSCQNSNKAVFSGGSDGLRIISLAPSLSKELTYLGVKDNIVGATSYCDISIENPDLIVGSAIEINIEKILLLRPTLVFATGLTTQTNIETLRENGVTVYQIGKMFSFQHICNEFITMGKMVGKEQEAVAIINNAKSKIDSLQRTIPEQGKKKVFFQIGAKPLFAVIPNTFMDDLITYAKCENLADDVETGTITRESVLNRNPDVIFVATMGIVGSEEKQIWESYKELNAVKNNTVFTIDSNTACTPSVIAFTETLTQMIQEIYE